MGQAKLRGTRDERVAQAIERERVKALVERELRAKRNVMRYKALNPADREALRKSMDLEAQMRATTVAYGALRVKNPPGVGLLSDE